MATPNTPDMTEPTSRGQAASIGIIANIGANRGIGYAVANKGGEVYTGIASFNTFPVNQAEIASTEWGGAGQGPTLESSSNPLTSQENVAVVTAQNDATDNLAQTSTVQLDSDAVSHHTNYPSTNNDAEYSKVNGYTTLGASKVNYTGLDTNKTYVINDDLARMADKKVEVLAAGEEKKTDGAGQGANSVDKFVSLGDTVQTASMNTLPDGKDTSSDVGHE